MYGRTSKKKSTFEVIVRNVPEHNMAQRGLSSLLHKFPPFLCNDQVQSPQGIQRAARFYEDAGNHHWVDSMTSNKEKSLANEFEREFDGPLRIKSTAMV